MRKFILRIAAVICGMVTTVITSCDFNNENVTYITSYMYEVRMDYAQSVCYAKDASDAQNAFNEVIGTNGTYYQLYQRNQDSQMKAGCENVRKQFANTMSTYMKFDLIRTTVNSDPSSKQKKDTIGTYVMGQALTKPYVSYSITTNEKEAYAALSALKNTLDQNTYKASYRTLRTLLGIHSSSTTTSGNGSSTITMITNSAFDTHFKNEFSKVWEDSEDYDRYVAYACDSIASAHAQDTLAVQAVVTVSKIGFLNKEVTQLWTKTFPVTVE